MLTLKPPIKTDAALKAIAASGSSGLSKKAQAALRERTTEALRREMGR